MAAKKPVKKPAASGAYQGAFGAALGKRRKASMDEAIDRMAAGKGSKKGK